MAREQVNLSQACWSVARDGAKTNYD